MEKNEELENLVKEIQERTGFKQEFALNVARKINKLNENEEYKNFALKKKISTALNQLLNQTT